MHITISNCHIFKSDILLIIIYKGIFMKKVSIFILAILGIFFLTLCTEKTEEVQTKSEEIPKTNDAYIDTPMNTAKRSIETQNIANTIQNPSSYLGSRLDARGSSKNAVKQSNARIEEQNKAMDALTK